LQAECEWYQLCSKGKYSAYRCPTNGKGQRQVFHPITNNCTDSIKLPINRQCQSYKQCLVIESVSPFGKWTELSCGSLQHFDQESQECIDIKVSTCGKNFKVLFLELFLRRCESASNLHQKR
jgi:hypothetical protein